jgi:hypothetical protein
LIATNPPQSDDWAIYHLSGTPSNTSAMFIGFVYGQPDEASAIKAAIEAFSVPWNLQSRLMAQRRGGAD